MRDEDPRPLASSLGSAAIGIGLGVGILALGFAASRFALPDNVVAAATFTPGVSGVAGTIAPSPTQSATPKPSPTAAPTATADPMTVAAAQGQGLKLAAITIPAGYTFTSPIAGKVSIALYQWADGAIRTGLTDQPSYPYIFIQSASQQIKIRPGIVDKDVQLLVKDGDTVLAGGPLFKTLTTGASSWATFYDSSVTAEVIVSAVDLTSNQAIDPVPLFKR